MQMRKARLLKPALAVCGVIALVVALVGFVLTRAESGHLGVTVIDSTTNSFGGVSMTIEVTNRSSHQVWLPGLCDVESRAGATLVGVPIADVEIKPGEVSRLSVAGPNLQGDWRVAVKYYSGSPWNRFKIRLSSSSWGPKLPSGLLLVQGEMEWSPWIEGGSSQPR
jgi:hypothetical protein